MRAAKAISLGLGRDKNDKAIEFFYAPGEEIDDDHLEHIPDHLVLEKVAEDDPESLSREQLMVLAGLADDPDAVAPHEMSEEEVREALGALRTKADLLEWFGQVRPELDVLDPENQSRVEMEDIIVEELTQPPDED